MSNVLNYLLLGMLDNINSYTLLLIISSSNFNIPQILVRVSALNSVIKPETEF